jgi:hypothetical protein
MYRPERAEEKRSHPIANHKRQNILDLYLDERDSP